MNQMENRSHLVYQLFTCLSLYSTIFEMLMAFPVINECRLKNLLTKMDLFLDFCSMKSFCDIDRISNNEQHLYVGFHED